MENDAYKNNIKLKSPLLVERIWFQIRNLDSTNFFMLSISTVSQFLQDRRVHKFKMKKLISVPKQAVLHPRITK